MTEDGVGLSKAHTRHGKWLATKSIDSITDEDMNTISFFSKYYKGQLPSRLVRIIAEEAKSEEPIWSHIQLLNSILS